MGVFRSTDRLLFLVYADPSAASAAVEISCERRVRSERLAKAWPPAQDDQAALASIRRGWSTLNLEEDHRVVVHYVEAKLNDQADDPTDAFLQGPLLKKAKGLKSYLETYSKEWRAGAQAIGYREAAETLLDVVIERERSTSKTLLHPILFLYRHSIELRLKLLIEEHGRDLAPPHHDLKSLYAAAKEAIQRYLPETDFDKVDKVVAELHAIDPKSQTFRYATTTKGEAIEIAISEVDLVHLRTQMDHLDTFFWMIEIEIDQVQEYLAEIAEHHQG